MADQNFIDELIVGGTNPTAGECVYPNQDPWGSVRPYWDFAKGIEGFVPQLPRNNTPVSKLPEAIRSGKQAFLSCVSVRAVFSSDVEDGDLVRPVAIDNSDVYLETVTQLADAMWVPVNRVEASETDEAGEPPVPAFWGIAYKNIGRVLLGPAVAHPKFKFKTGDTLYAATGGKLTTENTGMLVGFCLAPGKIYIGTSVSESAISIKALQEKVVELSEELSALGSTHKADIEVLQSSITNLQSLIANLDETTVAIGGSVDTNTVVSAGSDIPRSISDRFGDIVYAIDFGAAGDGIVDDTDALTKAAEAAAKRPASLYMPGKYLVHGLTFPEGTHILGKPTFIDDGSGEASSYLVVFDKNSSVGDISLKMVENGNYRYGVRFNEGCSAGTVYVYAEGTRFNGEAAHLMGDKVTVDFLHTTYINRGGTVGAYSDIDTATGKTSSGAQYYQNIRLGGYHIDGCVQGLRLGRLAFSEIGPGSTIGLPDNVERTPAPGYNGVYISSCHDINIGDIASERALEHAVRIGGDDVAPEGAALTSYDIKFGDITAYRHGGSALKVNPGIKQRARNIYVGNVTSIDAGKRGRETNRRLSTIRVSHCDTFYAKYARSITYNLSTVIDGTYSPEIDVVEVNNSTRVVVDNVYGDIVGSSLIAINEENDVTLGEDIQSYSELSCRNLKFNNVRLSGHDSAPEFYMSRIYNTGMVVRNVAYSNVDVKGLSFTKYLHVYTADNFYDVYLDAADATGKLIDVIGGKIYVHGRSLGASPNILSSNQRFNRDNAISTASVLIKTPTASGVTGLSGAITFLRPSGNRPAGAVAGVQSEDQEGGGYSGLEFLTSAGQEATNALTSVWRMLPGRQLYPVRDDSANLGLSSNRLKEIFCANGAINTSDENEKQDVQDYTDEVLDAWGGVQFRQFLFRAAVEEKGDAARIHSGVVAQQVVKAFADKGLDASRYGLLCYDKWGDEYETVEVVDAPAVLDAEGDVMIPEQTHKETHCTIEAGERYGIRYNEALCLEAAYQRRRAQRLEERIKKIEEKLEISTSTVDADTVVSGTYY